MIKMLKKYFIPHNENEYKPHLLREFSVAFLVLFMVVLIPFFAFIYPVFITSDFILSAVFPYALVGYANEARSADGATFLTINHILEEAAKLKIGDMIKNNYFAHESPEGLTPWHWLKQAGYEFSAAGENLAIDFSDSSDVSSAWLNSPGHRANILNKKFTEIGVATARGIYNGRETTFVVQFFGKPKAVAAGAMPTPSPTNILPIAIPTEIVAEPNPTVLAAEDELNAKEKTDLFIVVSDSGGEEKAGGIIAAPGESFLQRKNVGAVIFETMSSPKTLLAYSYIFLSLLISLSLLFVVFIEASRRHARHIVYGVFLLILSVGAFYSSMLFFPASVVVIL
jgi:hypothetical protein